MKLHKVSFNLFLLILVSSLSIGAWWDREKKKEEPKKERTEEVKKELTAEAEAVKESEEIIAAQTNEGSISDLTVPTDSSIETENVQKELTNIIEQTSQLQNQVQDNRAELAQIMERAQIHSQILKTIKVPPTVPKLTKVPNTDTVELIEREKLRLISEQTKQAQQQLEIIQRTRTVKPEHTSS